MTVQEFLLIVSGKPEGKDRPRFNHKTGRTYTTKKTTLAESEIRRAWEDLGQPRFERGVPLRIDVVMVVTRPQGHFKKDGSLSAQGLRMPYPTTRKPDADNCLKLCMDSLNSRAYHDDVQIVSAHVDRIWGENPETRIKVRELPNLKELVDEGNKG